MYNKTKFDIHEYVNGIMMEQLGKIKSGENNYLFNADITEPFNPISGTRYSASNWVILFLVATSKSYRLNAWATRNQIIKAGGNLRKGAKAAKIIYYNFIYSHKGKKISREQYMKLKKTLPASAQGQLDKKGFLKYSNVFNFSYVEGLDHLVEEFDISSVDAVNIHSGVEKIVSDCGAKVFDDKINVAHYNYGADEIHMPMPKYFKSSEKYNAVLLHELSHWTGHETRLQRKMEMERKAYAYEELVAEISAAYLCVRCGIESELYNSVAYVDGWLKALENDKEFVLSAMKEARKAYDYLLEPQKITA